MSRMHRALSILLLLPSATLGGYVQNQEPEYLSNFDLHIAASYTEADSTPFLDPCKNGSIISGESSITVTPTAGSTTISSTQVQQQCSPDQGCVIPQGLTLEMIDSLNVGSLTLEGQLLWTDDTQSQQEAYLCAGYVVTEDGGEYYMNLSDKKAIVYIKNNGAKHSSLATRVFGGNNGRVEVIGRHMKRTWSLLDKPLSVGDTQLTLLHDPTRMKWKVGDRIGVAPTEAHSKGTGQTFTIINIAASGEITIDTASDFHHKSEFYPPKAQGQGPILMSAEVVNLSRNIIITGDDFEHIPCDPTLTTDTQGCMCTNYRSKCTVGLHTIQAHTGLMRISNTRIEKCGQRGIMGKYCMHFHMMGDCPDCLFADNAIETSHARGIIVHGTHRSEVKENVLWNVRGAGIYVEDGNEMENSIKYNVVVCPFPLNDAVHNGCTIPGTQNGQSDTALNQASFYLKSATNDLVGNRGVNSFNGMLIDPGAEGAATGKVCAQKNAVGRWEGNTLHGHGRFGTYPSGYPLDTDRTLESSGFNIDASLCNGFDSQGMTRGRPAAVVNNVDYDNVFVGQYNVGDVQYKGHVSMNNLNLIYWKETKNFEDGCSAHMSGSYYANGNLALPDQATFIIEDTVLENVHLEANHHCQVGWTGFLCMPQYIFHNSRYTHSNEDARWVDFLKGASNFGGIFTLSPTSSIQDSPFPDGFTSLVSSRYTYLLAAPNGDCVSSTDLGLGNRYDNGILCKRPLRALKIFSRGLADDGTAPGLLVEAWFNSNGIGDHSTLAPSANETIPFHQVGNTESNRQGYSLPVIPASDVSYRLSLTSGNGGIPSDWVIEFSDPVVTNRWGQEQVQLDMVGRSCGVAGIVDGQHDRRFIYNGYDLLEGDVWGNHGACVASPPPNMPTATCTAGNSILPTECPELCPSGCDTTSSYCDCRTATCQCKAGFTGSDCSIDLCASARCDPHGTCAALYLGESTLPVTSGDNACICEEGWSGSLCDKEEFVVVASSSTSKQEANNCLDSNPGTRWESGHTDSEWLVIDLGRTLQLSVVELHWEGAYGKQYNIDISDDAVFWTTAYSESNGNGGIDTIDVSGHSGRYVRMYGIQRGTPWGYSLWEVKLSGPTEVYVPSCDCSTSNDCEIPGSCLADGTCSTPLIEHDGTPCNSVPYGICSSGFCMATPTPAPVTPSPVTPAPVTPAPVTPSPVTQAPVVPALLIPISGAQATSSQQPVENAIDGNHGSRWESEHGIDNVSLTLDLGMEVSLGALEIYWEGARAEKYQIEVSTDNISFTSVYEEESGNGPVDTMNFGGGIAEARYVRLAMTKRLLPYGYSIFEIKVFGWGWTEPPTMFPTTPAPVPSNPASLIPISNIEATSSQQPAANAIDGIQGSRWESVHGIDDVWMTLDLGMAVSVGSLEIDWEGARAEKYRIEVSTDNMLFESVYTEESGNGGVDTINFGGSGVTARYVRLAMTKRLLPYGYSIWEIQVFGWGWTPPPPPAGPMLLPIASAVATSSHQPIQNAVDGIAGTRWESAHGIDDISVTVDLGETVSVDSVEIFWEAARAKQYTIAYSIDNILFSIVYTENAGSGLHDIIEFDSDAIQAARFIRIDMTERCLPYGYSIWEIEVYGSAIARRLSNLRGRRS